MLSVLPSPIFLLALMAAVVAGAVRAVAFQDGALAFERAVASSRVARHGQADLRISPARDRAISGVRRST